MSGYLIELMGGLHDGAMLSRSSRPEPFVYVDASKRFRREPGPGRDLYRLSGSFDGVAGGRVIRYRFAQHEQVQCGGCGFYVPRSTEECVLCERPLAA